METDSETNNDFGPVRCSSSEEILPSHEIGISKPFRNLQLGISRIFPTIPALQRSFSSPRDSTIHAWPTWLSSPFVSVASLKASPLERLETHRGVATLGALPAWCCCKSSNSKMWQQDGSFHWKRVKTRRRGLSELVTAFNDQNDNHSSDISPIRLLDNTVGCSCVNTSKLLDPKPSSCCSPVLGGTCPPQVPPRISPMTSDATNRSTVLKKLYFGSPCQPPNDVSPPTKVVEHKKSFSLDHNRFSVRIYPVVQNGIKISDTHYWLLDPPRSFSAQCTPALLRHQSERVPPPSLASGDSSTVYLNIPTTMHFRRAESSVNREAADELHIEMIKLIKEEVPEATQAECQAVLIGCGYKYEHAVKRLKLELLYRRGYVSLSRCKRLLHKCNWDLSKAREYARLESESSKLRRMYSTHTCSSPSFVKGPPLFSLYAPNCPRSSDSSFTHGSSDFDSQLSPTSIPDREHSFRTKDI
ncbi:unnamed protein product [Dicrocoelium dendriticum]|nr:unnamed protein product [Dicrocoelium dendriticum]